MSDTPRTDAEAKRLNSAEISFAKLQLEFARSLERELADTRRRLEAAADVMEPHWRGAGVTDLAGLLVDRALEVNRDADLDAERADLQLAQFKDAWEAFQSDFYKAADFDEQHDGAYIITETAWSRLLRAVNAVIAHAIAKKPL